MLSSDLPDGTDEARRILDKRLTKCVLTGPHYPFIRQPLRYDPREMLYKPQPPVPWTCARCGIGGGYRIYFDVAGKTSHATLL